MFNYKKLLCLFIVISLLLTACDDNDKIEQLQNNGLQMNITDDEKVQFNQNEKVDTINILGDNVTIDGSADIVADQFLCSGDNINISNIGITVDKFEFNNCSNISISNTNLNLTNGIKFNNCKNITIDNNIIKCPKHIFDIILVGGDFHLSNNQLSSDNSILNMSVDNYNGATIVLDNNLIKNINEFGYKISCNGSIINAIQVKNTTFSNTEIKTLLDFTIDKTNYGTINQVVLENLLIKTDSKPNIIIKGANSVEQRYYINQLIVDTITLNDKNIDNNYHFNIMNIFNFGKINQNNVLATGYSKKVK